MVSRHQAQVIKLNIQLDAKDVQRVLYKQGHVVPVGKIEELQRIYRQQAHMTHVISDSGQVLKISDLDNLIYFARKSGFTF